MELIKGIDGFCKEVKRRAEDANAESERNKISFDFLFFCKEKSEEKSKRNVQIIK